MAQTEREAIKGRLLIIKPWWRFSLSGRKLFHLFQSSRIQLIYQESFLVCIFWPRRSDWLYSDWFSKGAHRNENICLLQRPTDLVAFLLTSLVWSCDPERKFTDIPVWICLWNKKQIGFFFKCPETEDQCFGARHYYWAQDGVSGAQHTWKTKCRDKISNAW